MPPRHRRPTDALLAHLGLAAEAPTLDYLHRLVAAHQRRVPFETLSKLIDHEPGLARGFHALLLPLEMKALPGSPSDWTGRRLGVGLGVAWCAAWPLLAGAQDLRPPLLYSVSIRPGGGESGPAFDQRTLPAFQAFSRVS
jgi:hypothetical protein